MAYFHKLVLLRLEAVNRILNRVLYAGYVESEKWNIPLQKAKHEGLISFATYQKIQERLHGKPKIAVRSDVADDFPLRGFVECGDCGNPLTACWSKSKTGTKHPYYMCHKKGCASKGKSIRRAKMEEEFEELLATAQPTKSLSKLTRAMLKKAWGILSEHEAATKHAVKQKLLDTEKSIEKLLDQIVESENATVIKNYEKRITKLEREKLVLQEKLDHSAKNRRPFEEMFELTMKFFSNPHKVWELGKLEHKRTVLKLAFKDRLAYCRKSGFRTPDLSSIFKALGDKNMLKMQMAESEGFEPSRLLLAYTLSNRAPSTTRPRLQTMHNRICPLA